MGERLMLEHSHFSLEGRFGHSTMLSKSNLLGDVERIGRVLDSVMNVLNCRTGRICWCVVPVAAEFGELGPAVRLKLPHQVRSRPTHNRTVSWGAGDTGNLQVCAQRQMRHTAVEASDFRGVLWF